MTQRLRWVLGSLLVLILVLAACGGDDGNDEAEPTAPPAPTSTTAVESEPDNGPDTGTGDQADADPAADIDPEIAALLPDAPAPLDGDFRSDSAAVVGATGRPQLLEFFTYW